MYNTVLEGNLSYPTSPCPNGLGPRGTRKSNTPQSLLQMHRGYFTVGSPWHFLQEKRLLQTRPSPPASSTFLLTVPPGARGV